MVALRILLFFLYNILKVGRNSIYFNMKTLKTIAWILVIIGGLNWGLVGLMEYDLVAAIFGSMSAITKIVYDLVGLSALYLLLMKPKKQVE